MIQNTKYIDTNTTKLITDEIKDFFNRFGAISTSSKTPLLRLYLDYDNTLAPYGSPPSKKLLSLLDQFLENDLVEVTIISARSMDELDAWFSKHRDIKLICNYCSKIKNGDHLEWMSLYKDSINFEELYTKFMPFFDSLHYSYRYEAPFCLFVKETEKASIKKHEAKNLFENEYKNFIDTSNLSVLDSPDGFDILPAELNKGNAVKTLLPTESPTVVVAIGDSHSDEVMFKEIAKWEQEKNKDKCYLIKVTADGTSNYGNYFLRDFNETLFFLASISKVLKPTLND